MACSSCSACKTGCGCGCHRFTPPGVGARAAGRLIDMWDRARDAFTRAGLRPYGVCIVRERSASSRARGDGPLEIVGEWPILPTPKVMDMSGLNLTLDADQLREHGEIQVQEISLRYHEDILLGRGPGGAPVPPSESVYWEISWFAPDGTVAQKRRFVPSSPPNADVEGAQWTITLQKANRDRQRSGAPR